MIYPSAVLPSANEHLAPTPWESDPGSPRLGRFVVGPELGRGGMGVVHLAFDPMLRRHVALKRLLNADPMLALRFMREAQTQAKVDHPRICKVFEVGSEGEQPFIAMQYIQGPTLGEARDGLDLREKARLMAEVAGAIHAAHRMGLIHRDLKPSNILLEAQEDGRWMPFILDFGLARDQSVADLTLSWGMVGTPAFMSPEQAEAEDISPVSDIYSLGATFYALFGGHPPFEAITLAGLIRQQSTQTVRSLRRTVPGFPRDLDTILLKCLDSVPGRRYATAFDLEEDLHRWLAGEPIRARAIGPMGRSWRRMKRQRALTLSIVAGLGLSLALLGWNIRAGRRARVQVELAQRFGLQVREVEQLLRIERMLPPHDIQPAEAQVRQRMDEIRRTMGSLGTVSRGPGHYALGRGHLVLREFPAARKELEAAWQNGFKSPEVAYALGTTLLELFLTEASRINASDPAASKATYDQLRGRYVDQALSFFQQAQGQGQEDPAFGEAQVAMLKADYETCIQKCRAAFTSKPWMYEAKLLEARAWAFMPLGLGSPSPRPTEWEGALRESQEAVQTALRIGQSDERIYAIELKRLIDLSEYQADYGIPSVEVFERAGAVFSQTLKIRPGDSKSRIQWMILRAREGWLRLRLGQDVRPLMREYIQIYLPVEDQIREAGISGWLGHLYWILADGQWRRGEDPLPALTEAGRHYGKDGFVRIQSDILKASALGERGMNPVAVLDEAERILRAGMNQKDSPHSSYHGTVHGTLLLTRARWEWSEGIDPLPSLDKAQERLEANRDLDPRSVFPPLLLAEVHALKARRAASLGQSPEPELRAAMGAAQKAQELNPRHFRTQLSMAEVCQERARALMAENLDPSPALDQGRTALKAGLALNPTDFRLHLAGALVELTAARRALSDTRSPLEALARAEAAARRGLGFKADCARLWLALAKAQRLRAQWALKRGEATAPWVEEGLKHLRRALVLDPTLAESLAEGATLEGLQDGKKEVALGKLRACLKRNPFLALDYPAS